MIYVSKLFCVTVLICEACGSGMPSPITAATSVDTAALSKTIGSLDFNSNPTRVVTHGNTLGGWPYMTVSNVATLAPGESATITV
jgi:hypothetical protein